MDRNLKIAFSAISIGLSIHTIRKTRQVRRALKTTMEVVEQKLYDDQFYSIIENFDR